MPLNIKICIAIENQNLADEATRLCAAQGWTVLQYQLANAHPVPTSADFVLFDELAKLPLLRELLSQSSDQHAICLIDPADLDVDTVNEVVGFGLPSKCQPLAPASIEATLVKTITTTLNVARFETQFFNTQDAEPITRLPHHAELLDYVHRFVGTAMGLVVVEIDHAEHLYENLDPVSKTDLLSALSEHLQSCIVHSAYLAIYDAASFAIWCPNMSAHDTQKTAIGLCEHSRTPLKFRGGQLHFSLSAGAAHEMRMDNPHKLWQQAWAVKERAKLAGGNQASVAADENDIGRRIPQAITREEFGLVVQPQWNIQGTELRGVEALLRWEGMEVGNIAPDHFIPIAERHGQMARVGDWVLEQACTASAAWLEHRVNPMLLGINISPQQFVNDAIHKQIERLAKEQWLDPAILELELGHDKLLQVVDLHRSALFKLRDMGVRVAIDNLGTELVDTNKLLRCPADTLKIDRSLIANIEHDDAARRLVAQICQVGQRFSLRIVAVGVETEQQRQLLENLGCTDAQGYLFSQPVALDTFHTYLAQNKPERISAAGTQDT